MQLTNTRFFTLGAPSEINQLSCRIQLTLTSSATGRNCQQWCCGECSVIISFYISISHLMICCSMKPTLLSMVAFLVPFVNLFCIRFYSCYCFQVLACLSFFSNMKILHLLLKCIIISYSNYFSYVFFKLFCLVNFK